MLSSSSELAIASAIRLGLYRTVTVSSRYECKKRLGKGHLVRALSSIVSSQAMLRVGIEAVDDARFLHFHSIDLSRHLFFETLRTKRGEGEGGDCDDDELFRSKLQHFHDSTWEHAHLRPPWKVSVFYHDDDDDDDDKEKDVFCCDIVFAFHHSLADGISGRTFHQLLRRALNNNKDKDEPVRKNEKLVLLFPAPLPSVIPAPQEEAVPFSFSPSYWLKMHCIRLAANALAKPLNRYVNKVDDRANGSTLLLPINLSGCAAAALLAGCRSRKTTVTAVLHALVLTSLSRRLPRGSSSSFKAITAIDLRPYLDHRHGDDDDDASSQFRLLVSAYQQGFSVSEDEEESIWDAARIARVSLSARRDSLPADDIFGMPSCLNQVFSSWIALYGKSNLRSWLLSNIGVLDDDDDDDDDDEDDDNDEDAFCRISRVTFVGMPFLHGGPPIFVSVASVAGGAMTVVVSWVQGVVPHELATGLADDLRAWITNFADKGKFL
ncbi:hypothetical protein L249_8694 [Ophiocordyceps polyrhachis-furcata BCC 54312]|uniref:Alcohol acetyltransferase n=1 Tax=Ophiocordyceps polyrhachis-furcata BCC 54312 TaxID=1330021 RepID=A0A367L6F7_9HYPO|nr:hypothetical protein L249_8694 [Ophiocordyceps polyrhachis-furcata BCC 54312]